MIPQYVRNAIVNEVCCDCVGAHFVRVCIAKPTYILNHQVNRSTSLITLRLETTTVAVSGLHAASVCF